MKLIEMPRAKLVFMRRTGAYGSENEQLMTTFKEWLRANHLFNEKMTILGIAQDNPILTAPENCRYDVGLFEDFDDPTISQTVIEGGKYVVFTIDHTETAVKAFLATLFEQLEEAGLIVDDYRPILERYPYKMIENHLCEFCVPIK